MANPDLNLKTLLASNEAVFNWCLRSARQAYALGQFEAAAEWCSLAGRSAAFSGWFGDLASPALELLLLQLGAGLPSFTKPPSPSGKRRWLHVMTTAFEIGGHTNLVCRWMHHDQAQGCHSVIIVDQTAPFPEKLRAAAEATGGQVVLLDAGLKLLDRALELRKWSSNLADVVVLHLHPHDVAAVIAFGVPSDVPVCLMNHMDHLFWIGASVADVVIEFRDLGKKWSQKYRGVDRSVILPLPLESSTIGSSGDGRRTSREAARKKLGIDSRAVVLLTVATPYKYQSIREWNFLLTVKAILNQCPDALLIAVGPTAADLDRMWGRDVWRCDGRFQAVGTQKVMADYHAAADIGLGSFPFASQTATLECALAGLPCVPTPAAIRFGFDDIAFAVAPCPVNQADYAAEVIRLVKDPRLRESAGHELAASVAAHHCGSGWMNYLADLSAAIPLAHRLYAPQPVQRLDSEACEFWADFSRLCDHPALPAVHGCIIANGAKVKPKHDAELVRNLKEHQAIIGFPGMSFAVRNARFKLGKFRRNLLGQA